MSPGIEMPGTGGPGEPPSFLILEGCVLLPSGSEHDCLIRCMSADVFKIAVTDAIVEIGARVVCRTKELGTVEGTIGAATASGYSMDIAGSGPRLARLSARIAWHRNVVMGRAELRSDARIVPLVTAVRVTMPDGRTVEAELVDVSSTGAALRLLPRPPVGARLTVGRRWAEVVRDLDAGVAVRFVLPLRPEDVTPDITL